VSRPAAVIGSATAQRYTDPVTESRGRRYFATTRWSLVIAAGADHASPGVHDALAMLCETYWYPLYASLRGRGYSIDDAQDLTQAFFARVIEKQALRSADPARGRFRSFLLASLKNFAANERDRAMADKRGGVLPLLPLEIAGAEGRLALEPPTEDTPERVFDRRWALTLLDRVMSRLHAEAVGRGDRAVTFDRLKPYLTGDRPQLSYAQTAADLEMSEGAVKVAVHRLRRRFRDLIRDEIAQTVSSPEEIEDELRHLWSSLRR
jgi:DNA-directed RNA polymerase specialized sigma24 family protein